MPLDALFGGASAQSYALWRGSVQAFPIRDIFFRVVGQGGNTQFRLKKFDVVLTAPELREQIPSFTIPAEGGHAPITRPFRAIRFGLAQLLGTSDGAIRTRTVPSAQVSPLENRTIPSVLFQAFDAGGQPIATTLAAEVVGYG